MINKISSSVFFVFSILAILIISLACRLTPRADSSEDSVLLQTLEAANATQSALLTQVALEPVQPTAEIIPEEPLPTVAEPVDTPKPPDILYEGIGFSFGPEIAQSAFAETIPGEDLGEDVMPGMNFPTHFEFTFNGYAVSDHFHQPKIIVYPVEDYRAISSLASETIDNLDQFLTTQSRAGFYAGLPFLPMWPAVQFFDTNLAFIDFENGSGVRYLTMFGQAIYPIDNQYLFYTFQGLTDDGRYYVSAILPVTHPGLPDDGFAMVDDWLAFEDGWETYLSETTFWLDAQPSEFFNPSLADLDAMITSIQVNR